MQYYITMDDPTDVWVLYFNGEEKGYYEVRDQRQRWKTASVPLSKWGDDNNPIKPVSLKYLKLHGIPEFKKS